jgi:hypothetical protein
MDACIGSFKDIPREKIQVIRAVRIKIRGVMIPADDRDKCFLTNPVQSGAERQVKGHGKHIMGYQSIKTFQGIE